MTSKRKLVGIALAVMLTSAPLLATVHCPKGVADCVRVSENSLRNEICKGTADSRRRSTDDTCQDCDYTLLALAGRIPADYPADLQTLSITMIASGSVQTKRLATLFPDQAHPRAPRQLLLHGALLI